MEKILEELDGLANYHYSEVDELVESLGGKITNYDSKISDGCDDDDDDEYVMCDCLDIEKDGEKKTVRIYYGDITREVGWVQH